MSVLSVSRVLTIRNVSIYYTQNNILHLKWTVFQLCHFIKFFSIYCRPLIWLSTNTCNVQWSPLLHRYVIRGVAPLRPAYTGDICGDFSGDFCGDFKRDFAASKLLAIQIAAESPGSLHRRFEIASKIASVNGPSYCKWTLLVHLFKNSWEH